MKMKQRAEIHVLNFQNVSLQRPNQNITRMNHKNGWSFEIDFRECNLQN